MGLIRDNPRCPRVDGLSIPESRLPPAMGLRTHWAHCIHAHQLSAENIGLRSLLLLELALLLLDQGMIVPFHPAQQTGVRSLVGLDGP